VISLCRGDAVFSTARAYVRFWNTLWPITTDLANWPIRADWAFQKGGFEETGTKTEHFRQSVKRGAAAKTNITKNNVFFNFKSCKCILANTKNIIMNVHNMGTLKFINMHEILWLFFVCFEAWQCRPPFIFNVWKGARWTFKIFHFVFQERQSF